MKATPLKPSSLLLMSALLACAGLVQAQTPAPAPAPASAAEPAKPAEGGEDNSWTSGALKSAITNMSGLSSFHVSAEIQIAGNKPTLEGDLGEGTVSFRGNDGKGNIRQRRVVGSKFYISLDDGKTWAEDKEKNSTIFLSNVVTGPISPQVKVWEKAVFKPSEVKLGDEDTLLLEKPAQGKEPAARYWLVKDEKLGGLFIRKVSMTIAADDGDFPVTVTYTKLGVPVTITAPKL